MNEDEAKKCYDIAKDAIKLQQWDKADKFLQKSIKLFETPEAQVLLERIDYLRSNSAKSTAASTKTAKTATKSTKNAAAEPKDERPFTEDQVKVCREILRCKDYYEVLAVKRDFTDDDLKKAYRKRAIKVHPDKNAAPMATDAFKKVSAAMACLSDATKRRQYDQVGSAEVFE